MLQLDTLYKLAHDGDGNSAANLFNMQSHDVHIWLLNHDQTTEKENELYSLLSYDEQSRIQLFRFDYLRKRYLHRRATLRLLLAMYTNQKPADIIFQTNEHSKPFLPNEIIHFNVSHSEHMALIAFSHFNIGVDIEAIVEIDDAHRVVKYHFSEYEQKFWFSLGKGDNVTAFYKIWTSKEALVKLVGDGLQFPLKTFDTIINGNTREIHFHTPQAHPHFLYDVPTVPNFLASLVTIVPSNIVLKNIE